VHEGLIAHRVLLPARHTATGGSGVSRFSCMKFLCMPGFFDSAGSTARSRLARTATWPSERSDVIGILHHPFRSSLALPTDTPVQRFKCDLAIALAWLGARVVRYSFSVRLLHSQVGSRTGAALLRFGLSVAPRFLRECLTNRTVSPFPAPASSSPACGFPALGLPACFSSRLCSCFNLERLSLPAPCATLDIH
jgi:hypothetical protein